VGTLTDENPSSNDESKCSKKSNFVRVKLHLDLSVSQKFKFPIQNNSNVIFKMVELSIAKKDENLVISPLK